MDRVGVGAFGARPCSSLGSTVQPVAIPAAIRTASWIPSVAAADGCRWLIASTMRGIERTTTQQHVASRAFQSVGEARKVTGKRKSRKVEYSTAGAVVLSPK